MIRKLLFLLYFVSINSIALESVTKIKVTKKFEDKEYFSNLPCEDFMTKEAEYREYFKCATEVSQKAWRKDTHQYWCAVEGIFLIDTKPCQFRIWDGGKGLMKCEDEKKVYLSCKVSGEAHNKLLERTSRSIKR